MFDAAKLFRRVIEVPVTNDSLPFLFTGTGDDLNLTILQRAILDNVQGLHKFTTVQVKRVSCTFLYLLVPLCTDDIFSPKSLSIL